MLREVLNRLGADQQLVVDGNNRSHTMRAGLRMLLITMEAHTAASAAWHVCLSIGRH
jgi:hypothetical protein